MLLATNENAENLPDSEIASRYKVTVRTVKGLRRRFVEEGFEQVVYGKKRTAFKEKTIDGRMEADRSSLQ